jgi:hypothetical protein
LETVKAAPQKAVPDGNDDHRDQDEEEGFTKTDEMEA